MSDTPTSSPEGVSEDPQRMDGFALKDGRNWSSTAHPPPDAGATGEREKSGSPDSFGQRVSTDGVIAQVGYDLSTTTAEALANLTNAADVRLVRAIHRIAADIFDRDRRVVILACRHDLESAVQALVAPFAATGSTVLLGRQDNTSAVLREALERPADGPRVFIERMSLDRFDYRQWDDSGPAADAVRLQDLLEAANARLVLAIEFGQKPLVSQVMEALPGAYILPWFGLWLAEVGTKADGVIAKDLLDRYGPQFDACLDLTRTDGFERERALYTELLIVALDWLANSPSSNRTKVKAALDKLSMEELAGDLYGTRDQIDKVFSAANSEGETVEIGRLLLTLSVFAEGEPIDAFVWMVRNLLPEGGPLLAGLPDALAQTWQRLAVDASGLSQPAPAMPSYDEAFNFDPDYYLNRAQLRSANGRIGPAPRLAHRAIQEELGRSRRNTLSGIVQRIEDRRLYDRCAPDHLPTLANTHIRLQRTLAGGTLRQQDARNLALTMLGLQRGESDLPLTDDEQHALYSQYANILSAFDKPPPPPLPTLGKLADWRRMFEITAAANPQWAEAFGRMIAVCQQQESQTLVLATNRMNVILAGIEASGLPNSSELMAELLEALAVLPPATVLAVVAGAVLSSASIDPRVIGRLTVGAFERCEGGERGDLGLLLSSMINAVVDFAGIDRGKPMPAVERWPIGLHLATETSGTTRQGLGLATFVEDQFCQREILWDLALVEAADRRLPVAASRVLRSASPHGLDLLIRLMTRKEREWIDRLAAYAGRFGAETVDDLLLYRLGDVEAVILAGADRTWLTRGEGYRICRERLWRRLGEPYGFISLRDRAGALAALLEWYEKSSIYRNDARLGLLSLFPAALLVEWRLRLFGPQGMRVGDPATEAWQTTLLRLRASLSAASRIETVCRALDTLAAGTSAIADLFSNNQRQESAARLRGKARVIAGLSSFLGETQMQIANISVREADQT